jgi:hypothetical protein
MAEATQFTFKLSEVLEMLVKHLDVHEGQWSLLLGIQLSVGAFGPTPADTFPGGAVSLRELGIARVEAGTKPGPGSIVVDAAVVNPKE